MHRGIIYKIVCNITGEQYIGSTTNLNKRISMHKSPSNNCSSRQIIDRGDYEFVNLAEINFVDKTELHMLEAEYIKANDCINQTLPFVPKEEQKERKKIWMREYMREYQKQEKVKVYAKNYYHNYYKNTPTTLCPCGGKYKTTSDMNKHFKTKKHQKYLDSLIIVVDPHDEDIEPQDEDIEPQDNDDYQP